MSHYSIRPEMVNYLLQNGYNFEPTRYIREGYNLFKQYALGFILFTVLLSGIQLIGEVLDVVRESSLFSTLFNLVAIPLSYGYLIVAHKIYRGEKPIFSDFFSFFSSFDKYIITLAYAIFGTALIMLGFIVFILPGIYLAVGYMFGANFLFFGGFGVWESLEMSRKLVAKNWWLVFGFCLLLFLVIVAGVACLGVGILAALPIMYCAIYAAFADLMQQADAHSWQYLGEPETDTNEGF
jgi:uncharacterized membrane protein